MSMTRPENLCTISAYHRLIITKIPKKFIIAIYKKRHPMSLLGYHLFPTSILLFLCSKILRLDVDFSSSMSSLRLASHAEPTLSTRGIAVTEAVSPVTMMEQYCRIEKWNIPSVILY